MYYGSCAQHPYGLGTAAYDSGPYDQGMWLLSTFDPVRDTMGRNLLGDHPSFILLVLVPFYWFAPGAWILFWSQAAVIGLGARRCISTLDKRLGHRGLRSFSESYTSVSAVLGAL